MTIYTFQGLKYAIIFQKGTFIEGVSDYGSGTEYSLTKISFKKYRLKYAWALEDNLLSSTLTTDKLFSTFATYRLSYSQPDLFI